MVGKRDAEYANVFIADLAARMANRIQLTSDGHKSYIKAVDEAFGNDIDYAMLVKLYGGPQGNQAERKYSAVVAGIIRPYLAHPTKIISLRVS